MERIGLTQLAHTLSVQTIENLATKGAIIEHYGRPIAVLVTTDDWEALANMAAEFAKVAADRADRIDAELAALDDREGE